jgi:hypothetical protein
MPILLQQHQTQPERPLPRLPAAIRRQLGEVRGRYSRTVR